MRNRNRHISLFIFSPHQAFKGKRGMRHRTPIHAHSTPIGENPRRFARGVRYMEVICAAMAKSTRASKGLLATILS
ncbi:TPA: hypothetical protein ENG04_02950, partial [Candidatus Poribacteria bacterium]|nr:hypothetical protein [Candidatus Poribacteria bacterium]HEX29023.1 hypothetical protein [Candidatus Poribacteria bacterium]